MAHEPTDSDGGHGGRDLVADATDLIGTAGLWSGQLLYAAVQLGIVDRLAEDAPGAASTVAADLDLHPDHCTGCCGR